MARARPCRRPHRLNLPPPAPGCQGRQCRPRAALPLPPSTFSHRNPSFCLLQWEKGRTHESLSFGLHTQTNRLSGAPVSPIPAPLADLVAWILSQGEALGISQERAPFNAVLVEIFNPGQWLPPRPEPAQFARPTVIVALCDETSSGSADAAESSASSSVSGASSENLLHICSSDEAKMVGNGLFENTLAFPLKTGTVVVNPLGEDVKMALGVSQR